MKKFRLDYEKSSQLIEVKFLAPTNCRGARIKITDKSFNTSVVLDYDYRVGNIQLQGAEFLVSKGYSILSFSHGDNKYYFSVVRGTSFCNIKEC